MASITNVTRPPLRSPGHFHCKPQCNAPFGAVGKVKIPLPLRDFQVEWESSAFGLFHGTAFSTALVPIELRGGLAGCTRTCQNFRNSRARISGTHIFILLLGHTPSKPDYGGRFCDESPERFGSRMA
jgi:hypothetical protein